MNLLGVRAWAWVVGVLLAALTAISMSLVSWTALRKNQEPVPCTETRCVPSVRIESHPIDDFRCPFGARLEIYDASTDGVPRSMLKCVCP